MSKQLLFVLFIQLFISIFCDSGVVLLQGTSGNSQIAGKITLQTTPEKTTVIYGTISGLQANSIHGFHIHQYGDLSKEDGTATGKKNLPKKKKN